MGCEFGFPVRRRAVLALLWATWLPGVLLASQGDWPAWRYDAGRTAASPVELPAGMQLQWKRELPEPLAAFPHDPRLRFDSSYEPIAIGKQIVVPSMVTDSVTAFDSDTGRQRWTFFADGPVRFAPLAWEGKVYFVADDGCLYCLNADDGRLVWKFCGLSADRLPYKLLGNERLISRWPARGGPVLADGIVHFTAGLWPGEGVFVYAVDAATGRLVWVNKDGGFVKEGLLDHGTRRDGGISPQGYLTVLGSKLVVPCGRALPAFFDRKTGQMEPYTTGWGGRVALAKGCWYVCGIGDYLFQSGDMYELPSHPAPASSADAPELQVSMADFASQMSTSSSTVQQWIKSFGLDGGEEAGTPFVRVRSGGPVTYLSWWTSKKPGDLRPGEQRALESRVRLQVDPANMKELGIYREPVLTRETIYYSIPEVRHSNRFKDEDRHPPTSANYSGMVGCDITRAPTWSSTYQGGWGTPYRLVQWPAASFEQAWNLPTDLKAHIKAGSRLYAGAQGVVAAMDLPSPGGRPSIGWRATIEGTPSRMLAANGKLLVVTAEGSLYCFGAAQATPATFTSQPEAQSPADPWTSRAQTILEQTGIREGYCLALGLGSGRLVEELARQSTLRIVVIDSDVKRVAAGRTKLHAAGLYGLRVHVVPGDLQSLRLPPLMASLIVSENLEGSGFDEQRTTVERLFATLRPYGGVACLPVATGRHAALAQVVQEAKLAGAKLVRSNELTLLSREGALPDASDWTHESGSAAHTYASLDRLARPPFGVLWFGGELDRVIPFPDGPIPRIAAGRMFLPIEDDLHAVDIYTGRHLWQQPLRHIKCLVATDTDLYAVAGGVCLRIDAATGDSRGTVAIPPSLNKAKVAWGEIRVAGDELLGSIGKHRRAGSSHSRSRRRRRFFWARRRRRQVSWSCPACRNRNSKRPRR